MTPCGHLVRERALAGRSELRPNRPAIRSLPDHRTSLSGFPAPSLARFTAPRPVKRWPWCTSSSPYAAKFGRCRSNRGASGATEMPTAGCASGGGERWPARAASDPIVGKTLHRLVTRRPIVAQKSTARLGAAGDAATAAKQRGACATLRGSRFALLGAEVSVSPLVARAQRSGDAPCLLLRAGVFATVGAPHHCDRPHNEP
jgi:hypothetical protein